MSNDYEAFKKNILYYTGINLDCYKEEQMKRRIDSLILRNNYGGYEGYYEKIKSSKAIYDEFLSYMTINVSEFFRNPEQWDILEKDIIPTLLCNHNGNINIWSAACSTGDEPYTIVMMMANFMPIEKINVFATDIDSQILEKAKTGLYTSTSLKRVPEDYIRTYFQKVDESTYKISDKVKSRVTFKQHNLLADKYPTNMDLIVCRNVLIYFTEAAKNEVYQKFYDCMSSKSALFIGSTEQVMKYREIGFDVYKSFFYKKGI